MKKEDKDIVQETFKDLTSNWTVDMLNKLYAQLDFYLLDIALDHAEQDGIDDPRLDNDD